MAPINRRDFLNGAAIGIGASIVAGGNSATAAATASVMPLQWPENYPPKLTGLRGAHEGSYEVAHSMSWKGANYGPGKKRVDQDYDLVVVGAGLSGLATARYFQMKNPQARILILDNHDDFGGHAKRNEFDVDGKKLIGFGGSQSISNPSAYSKSARALLKDVGFEPRRFYKYFDRSFFVDHDLSLGLFFDKAHYGEDQLTQAPMSFMGALGLDLEFGRAKDGTLKDLPLSKESKRQLKKLLKGGRDPFKKMSRAEKSRRLSDISYIDYLRKHQGVNEEVLTLLNRILSPLEAMAWESLPASQAVELLMPGTLSLKAKGTKALKSILNSRGVMPENMWQRSLARYLKRTDREPYIFHFPDGNAGLARLIVRKLLPHTASGDDMDDVVLSRFDYDVLDHSAKKVRIRLKSTVVDVRHTKDKNGVDVSYARSGKVERVRAHHAVLACNHKVIPYLCKDLPEEQNQALDQSDRAPLAYINVALRNWRAFKKAGTNYIYAPQAMFPHMMLDFPVSMGGVTYSQNPDEPIILHIPYTPSAHIDPAGKSARDLFKEGAHWLYVMSFEDFEIGIKTQLKGALGAYGFDPEKDIAAITVNRWPHGYAYTPNSLHDEHGPDEEGSSNIIARQKHGRIAIANSDAEYKAYVDGAFDSAWRAVGEITT